METEPLLIPYPKNPRRKSGLSLTTPATPSLSPLPEHQQFNNLLLPSPSPSYHLNIPQPSPKDLKDLLIFGPSSSFNSSPNNISIDALTLDSPLPFHNQQPQQAPTPPAPTLTSPCHSASSISSFPWAKTNLHRSKTAPAMSAINDIDRHSSPPKPQVTSASIVRQAFLLLIVYLSLGVTIYSLNRDHFVVHETHPVVDALYFCIVTMCTIGYGDITPKTTSAKIFSIMFVLVGFGFVDILLSGMVSYVLDLQENLLLGAVKGGGEHDLAGTYIFDLKKGRMRIRMKVGLALGVVVLCIGLGTGVMHFVERLGWLDSFYLSVMSVTTVGYGDRAFTSLPGRLFASIWLLVSTLAVARAFLYLAEARIDKRHRMMANWVLGQDMTISEFLAADIDNNGFVRSLLELFFVRIILVIVFLASFAEGDNVLHFRNLFGVRIIYFIFACIILNKSEYVIYKLKEMGKIAEKDIMQICNQFDRLDTGSCGKITLADLMENHH